MVPEILRGAICSLSVRHSHRRRAKNRQAAPAWHAGVQLLQARDRDRPLAVFLQGATGGPGEGAGAVEDDLDGRALAPLQHDQMIWFMPDGDAAALRELDLDAPAIRCVGVMNLAGARQQRDNC